MNFIKDLCHGKRDEYIHNQFVRFGKGDYERFMITVKNGKNLTIKTSFDFCNELVGMIAELAKENISVKGKIIANYDFEKEIESTKFSKRGKLYTAEIDMECTPENLRKMHEKFKNNWMLLKLKTGDMKMSSKGSLPKPGSPLKDNFCSATLPASKLDEFAFDFDKKFKLAKIVHKLQIENVEIPEQYKNDFALARMKAIRKGKLIREIDLDGNQIKKEYRLEV